MIRGKGKKCEKGKKGDKEIDRWERGRAKAPRLLISDT